MRITGNKTIYYINGPDAGFETIQTFAITTDNVTNNVVQYWLDKQLLYTLHGL